MRFAAAIFFALFVISAQAQQAQAPGVPSTISSQPTTQSLPTGVSVGDRELILMMIAERDRQYDQRFRAQEIAVTAALAAAKEAVAAALTAAKEAVTKAEGAAEKRFDSVNEFRNTLKDQQQTLASKAELDVRFKFFEDKLKLIDERQARALGSTEGTAALWPILFGVGSFVLAGIVVYRSRRLPA